MAARRLDDTKTPPIYLSLARPKADPHDTNHRSHFSPIHLCRLFYSSIRGLRSTGGYRELPRTCATRWRVHFLPIIFRLKTPPEPQSTRPVRGWSSPRACFALWGSEISPSRVAVSLEAHANPIGANLRDNEPRARSRDYCCRRQGRVHPNQPKH